MTRLINFGNRINEMTLSIKMKNWKIIVITLLLTVLYVVSVQQALIR